MICARMKNRKGITAGKLKRTHRITAETKIEILGNLLKVHMTVLIGEEKKEAGWF